MQSKLRMLLCFVIAVCVSSLFCLEVLAENSASCRSSSGTECALTCDEGTLTLVCGKTDKKKCSGSCSRQNDQKSAALNLFNNLYLVTERQVSISELRDQLINTQIKLKRDRFSLNFGHNNIVEIILITDFREGSKQDWLTAINDAAKDFQKRVDMMR